MKKFLKYICFFTVLFSLCFVDKVKAEDDYLFYCDYSLPVYNILTQKTEKRPLRAYIYNNKTAKFFDISKDSATEIVYTSYQGMTTSEYYFDINKYYEEATKEDGKYVCPSIGAELKTVDIRGYKRNYYYLSFDSNDNSVNKYPSTTGAIMNPDLEGTEEGDKIESGIVKITHQCSPKSIVSDKDNKLRYSVEITLYMKSDGKKYVKVRYGTYVGEAEFDSVNGARVDVVIGKYSTPSGSIPIKDLFLFYGEDANIMFSQNTMQINNNTFTCPTVLPSIGIDKTSVGNGPSGSLTSTGGTIYTVAYSQEVKDEYGKDDTFNETVDVPLGELLENNSQIVSGNRGTCTYYLGSASDNDSIAKFLDQIYTLIKIGAILIVIVMTMLELAGTVTGNKDNLTEVLMKGVKRLVILVIILLLPTFIDLIGNIFDIEDILCGIK